MKLILTGRSQTSGRKQEKWKQKSRWIVRIPSQPHKSAAGEKKIGLVTTGSQFIPLSRTNRKMTLSVCSNIRQMFYLSLNSGAAQHVCCSHKWWGERRSAISSDCLSYNLLNAAVCCRLAASTFSTTMLCVRCRAFLCWQCLSERVLE